MAAWVLQGEPLRLEWKEDYLTISRADLPGGEIKVHYLEAYCRPGSHRRKWQETVIGHTTRLVSAEAEPPRSKNRCRCIRELPNRVP